MSKQESLLVVEIREQVIPAISGLPWRYKPTEEEMAALYDLQKLLSEYLAWVGDLFMEKEGNQP